MITHLIINGSTPIDNDNTLRFYQALTSNLETPLNLSINRNQPVNLSIEQLSCDEDKEHFGCIEFSNNYLTKQSSNGVKMKIVYYTDQNMK